MAELVIKLVNGELAGKTVQSLRKEINAAAREAAKAEIGTKAWVDAHQRLDKAKRLQEDLKKQIDSTRSASDQLKEAWTKLVPFSGTLEKFGEGFGHLQKGVGGLTRSMGLLKAALISTGIGALVVLLGSLVTWLTSTQEGMDKLTSVMRPLGAIFQRLLGVVQELGGEVFKRLSDAIKDPRQAFIDLGDAIKDHFISRLEGIRAFGPALAKIFRGEFAEGFKDLGNAAIQASTGIKDGIDKVGDAAAKLVDFVDEAVEQGKRLDQLQKDIERAEINRIQRSKQLELIVAQQKKIAEDETASFEDRRAAAIAAMAAQEQLIRLEQSVLDKRIEKMELEHSLNDTSREEEKELAELKAKRFEVEARLTEQSIELRNKLNTLDKQQLEQQKAVQKNLQDLRIESMQEGFEKEVAQINKETEQRIEALKGTEEEITEQKLLLEAIRQQRIKDLREQFEKEQREKEREQRERAMAEAMDQNELSLAMDQGFLNERFAAQQITEEQFAQLSAENAIRYEKRKLDILREALGEQSIEYQSAYNNFLLLQKDAADQAEAIEKDKWQRIAAAVAGGAGVFANFFGALADMHEQGTEQWKEFATTQAYLSAIQGAVNAYTSTAAIPFIGPALAPIAAATALAAGMLRVQEIRKTKVEPPVKKMVKKAATGGPIHGPSHADGGVMLEAEGGEFIFSKKAVAAIGVDQLSSINDRYTVPRFQAGGPVMPFADRPAIPSAAAQAGQSVIRTDERPAWMDELIAAQDRRMDRIKVINVVTETEEGIKTVNQIRDDADV